MMFLDLLRWRAWLVVLALAIPTHANAEAIGLTPAQLKILVTANQLRVKSVAADGTVDYECLCGPTVNLNQISPLLIKALLNTEDKDFYKHRGVDPIAFLRAGKSIFTSGKLQGGSTLNMQLCKNRVFTRDQTLGRKINDVDCARDIDGVMAKDAILAAYFNTAFFGSVKPGLQIFGIENAARSYFGKPAREVNLYEAALLVGMLKSPRNYHPFKSPEAARKRALIIINEMLKSELVTPAQMAQARKTKLKRGSVEPIQFEHRFLGDWVLRLVAAKGVTLQKGVRIPITLQVKTQGVEQVAFRNSIAKFAVKAGQPAAFVTLSKFGEVLAMMGSQTYGQNQFNAAVDGKRPVASTFKAFVYAAALAKGKRGGSKIFNGAAFNEKWPEGLIPAREQWTTVMRAFANSDNIPALRLARFAGEATIIKIATAAGLGSTYPTGASFALGVVEASPLKLAGSYGIFLNEGGYVEPYGFYGVADSAGFALHWHVPTRRQVISKDLAKRMLQMLRAVVEDGTGRAALRVPDARGKSGTSDGNKDAWFVGLQKNSLTTVWIGKTKPEHATLVGGEAAAIWADIVMSLR